MKRWQVITIGLAVATAGGAAQAADFCKANPRCATSTA